MHLFYTRAAHIHRLSYTPIGYGSVVVWYCASWVHCESMTVIQWVFFCVSCRGLGDIHYGPYVGPLVSRPRAVVLPFSPEGGACHVYVRSCVRFRNYCLGRAACTRARTAFWSCRVQAFREVLRGARARQGVGCAVAGMAMRVACGRCTTAPAALKLFTAFFLSGSGGRK